MSIAPMLLVSGNYCIEGIMFNKFSYLVSVSVLTSMLMSSASHAVYEEELGEIISKFCSAQKSKKSSEDVVEEKSQEVKTVALETTDNSWWSYASYVGSTLKPVGNGMGNLVRWTGDQVRGESAVGDILTEKAKGAASYYGGSSASTIIDKVGESESTASSARQAFGNGLRWIGACMVEETKTLARKLRQFWIDKRETGDAEQVLTSTACALYLNMDAIGGVDGVKIEYRNFIEKWNSNIYTVHSKDPDKNNEYFLKGLIRGFAHDQKNIQSYGDIADYMEVFAIKYKELAFIKSITPESILDKGEEVGDVTIRRLEDAHLEAFTKFVQHTLSLEQKKLSIKKKRTPLTIEEAPSSSQPLIEDGSSTGETGGKDKGKEKVKEKEDKVEDSVKLD